MTAQPSDLITLTNDALTFAERKGATVQLRSTFRNGCCGGQVSLLTAEVGVPNPNEEYDVIDLSGMTIYVERGLLGSLHTPIRIGLDELFGLRALFVERM